MPAGPNKDKDTRVYFTTDLALIQAAPVEETWKRGAPGSRRSKDGKTHRTTAQGSQQGQTSEYQGS